MPTPPLAALPAGLNLVRLPAQPLTAESFAPFGQVIAPTPDGAVYGPHDAQLVLDQGIPRFYVMRLNWRPHRFERLTRHQRCTQCLGAIGGEPWWLAVAPPQVAPQDLQPDQIKVFRCQGPQLVKLEVGTWHAGPYFEPPTMDFCNLELSDTNDVDHEMVQLRWPDAAGTPQITSVEISH